MLTYLANVAYVLMLYAFITRDVLRLRSLLVVAQTLIVYYTWRNGVVLVSSWNAIFAVINLVMVVQILRERRQVEIPAELRELYRQHFSALAPPEFMRWWGLGRRDIVQDHVLVLAGAHPQWLYFILSGTVRVRRPGGHVMEVPAGFLVGEMSLLTGQPANADVEAVGRVEVMRWATDDLVKLRERKPAVWTQIQSVIGYDLVQKIQRGEHAPAH